MSSMDVCSSQSSRRHNPVDSICRKLQTIQWRGDREPNSPFQIPKLSTNSYDGPQCGFRHNLETILKKGAFHRNEGESGKDRRGMGMPSSAATQNGGMGSSIPLSTPTRHSSTPGNVTYTITSTLGERAGADGRFQTKARQRLCSTPAIQSKDSPYFTFSHGPNSLQSESETTCRSPPLSHTFTPSSTTISHNRNFCSEDATDLSECEMLYPALVVKRLSMGDEVASENKENMAEISLISEENLLDTIFFACDTQRRGKVYLSQIVEYLRHTTSRSSEDSGLEELCNMLDPQRKDVSIDLDTYHAVMREWIDECRNSGEKSANDTNQENSVKFKNMISAKKSMQLNMTSGSLEAIGGEASRAEFETSELIYCVSDLQMNNQKLQEELKKQKQVMESMEESNQKLVEENEELRNQAKINQQLAQKEKMLKEEVEEMKMSLSCAEEGRAHASAHRKNVEKENQSLIANIASLQDENFKITAKTDDLQNKMKKLLDVNTELQVQIDSFDSIIGEKDSMIIEKSRQVDELKAAIEEYSAITELLRVEKSKLENQIQMILPDLAGSSLSLTGAYRLNQGTLPSLQTELALAQSPLEAAHGVDHLPGTMSFVSPLDETLDREVLLMLQGTGPEYMSEEFTKLLNKLKKDFKEETSSILSKVRSMVGDDTEKIVSNDSSLEAVEAELDAKTAEWVIGLDQLSHYTNSLEHELSKMAGNLRRSRTEILHLSARVQEQKNQKRQLCDELEQLKRAQDSREASCQTPAPDEPEVELDWDEEFALQDLLKAELAERNCWPQNSQSADRHKKTSDNVANKGETDDGAEDEAEKNTVLSSNDSAACTEPGPEAVCKPSQAEALSAHSPAVSIRHPEADALPDPSHSENNAMEVACDQTGIQIKSTDSEQDQTTKPATILPAEVEMVFPKSPAHDETTSQSESASSLPSSDEHKQEEKVVEDLSPADMSHHKRLAWNHSGDRSAVDDGTSLLPVVLEEEEGVQNNTAGPPKVPVSPSGRGGLVTGGLEAFSESSSTPPGSSITPKSQSGSKMSNLTSDPANPQKLKHNMEVTGHQEELSETSMDSEREGILALAEMSMCSDNSDGNKDGKNSLSPTDKEIEAEFQRLALSFKCDMFTLEKRLRLEERSRDLAEENVRREVSSCHGLLQALIPLCEDDSQTMEIIHRLQKNLEILNQSMTRVSSRSEMLGAIHQENRIGKAVEVMIQHVENLRRTYTKEHAELLELREALTQSERSFGSQTEKDDFRGKKPSSSQYYKSSARRVSIAGIPRAGGSGMHLDLAKPLDTSETEAERLTRRSPWNVAGKNLTRPPLKRFVSSAAWVDTEEPTLMTKGTNCSTNNHSDGELKEELEDKTRRSSLSDLGSKITSLILPQKTQSPSSTPTSADPGATQLFSHSVLSSKQTSAAVARGSRGLWLWLAIVVLLAGLLAVLASLMMQPAVDAAPVGTGDSWMTIQKLLWPYTGLRYNGQPPV